MLKLGLNKYVIEMKTGVVIILLMFSFTAFSQRPSAGAWFTVNMPVKLTHKWQMHNDASYRTLGASASASQFLYRTGLRYQYNPVFSTAGGIAFFFTRTSFSIENHEFGREFRTWQELFFQTQLSAKLQGQLRFRSEQRFFESAKQKEAFTAHRFRLRSAAIIKVTDNWNLNVSEEYFRQLSHGNFSFDQNRVIVTAIRQIKDNTQLQAGYMWLLWPKSSSQHIVTITLQKTISLHGNKSKS